MIGTRFTSSEPEARRAKVVVRIALLSYRSKPHCGGQGIYVRHLSRELAEPRPRRSRCSPASPTPSSTPGVRLTKVPSLDLYREPDPFRTPKPREFRDLVDVEEFLTMCTGGFPEPKTFSTRVARLLRDRLDDFDVVHDNQVLGYGMLDIAKMGLPAGHHASTTRSPSTAASTSPRRPRWRKKLVAAPLVRLPADAGQGRPQAPQDPHAVSESSARDIARDFGVDPARHAGHPARRRRRLRAADRARACPAGSWRWPAPTPR